MFHPTLQPFSELHCLRIQPWRLLLHHFITASSALSTDFAFCRPMTHSYVLLKNSLGGPKLQYVLRASPCCDHPLLSQIDNTLKSAITQICNVTLSDDHWAHANLPVRARGLGIRSVSMLASSAYLASAAGTRTLQTRTLEKPQ
jgi:hypothetical protein